MDVDAFWAKVETSGDCWIWQGRCDAHGYGVCSEGLAHRVAYKLTYGSIPRGLLLRHHCDRRCCINPAHLTPGTAAENAHDKVQRGRATGSIPLPDIPHPSLTLSIPASRRVEFDAALLRLKQRRPFESISKIVAEAVIAAAAALDDTTKEPT